MASVAPLADAADAKGDPSSLASNGCVVVEDEPEYVGVNTSCAYLIEKLDGEVAFHAQRAAWELLYNILGMLSLPIVLLRHGRYGAINRNYMPHGVRSLRNFAAQLAQLLTGGRGQPLPVSVVVPLFCAEITPSLPAQPSQRMCCGPCRSRRARTCPALSSRS